MSKPMITLCLALIFLHTHFTICRGVSVLGFNSLESSELDAIMKRGCSKKTEDCLEEPEMMESEISRRVLLMQKKYVSYETLRRDMVPCTKPGASYYDCHAAAANPRTRGCEVITRCARAIQDIKT
uniref:Protein RALF-like 24 n=1 Tax=Rhizophora mucronata TaxID=61149 RepID=A0A2P2PKJ2_RHIMU